MTARAYIARSGLGFTTARTVMLRARTVGNRMTVRRALATHGGADPPTTRVWVMNTDTVHSRTVMPLPRVEFDLDAG